MNVVDVPERSRWEATADGAVAGYAEYERDSGRVVFTHTVVSLEGQGVGSALVRTALDAARADGLRVVARCPFVRGWIDKHPEYADLSD